MVDHIIYPCGSYNFSRFSAIYYNPKSLGNEQPECSWTFKTSFDLGEKVRENRREN